MEVDVGSSSLLNRKLLDQHAYASDIRCINATKRPSFLSLFVAIVEAAAVAAIEEAYFWSTTHAEAEPRCRFRWREGEREREREDRQTERRKDEEEEEDGEKVENDEDDVDVDEEEKTAVVEK